jgi:serine/threonine protein kinase
MKKLQEEESKGITEEFMKEIKVLFALEHPNIVRFYGIYKEENNNEYYLCTEFVSGGDLENYLKKNKNLLNEEKLLKLTLSGLRGLKYLERGNVIHRDIAARNFLVTSNNELKVSDFGMGRALREDQTHHQTLTINDTIPYAWVALEILKEKEGKRKYTHKSDIWSFGVTLWEIFTYCEKDPYEDLQIDLVLYLESGNRLKKGKIRNEIYEIMMKCWEKEPSKRPSFNQLYEEIKKLCPNNGKNIYYLLFF